jgi:hypothetical protein
MLNRVSSTKQYGARSVRGFTPSLNRASFSLLGLVTLETYVSRTGESKAKDGRLAPNFVDLYSLSIGTHSTTRKPTPACESALSTGLLAIDVLTETFSIVRHCYGVVFGFLYKHCHVNCAFSARRRILCVVVKSATEDIQCQPD